MEDIEPPMVDAFHSAEAENSQLCFSEDTLKGLNTTWPSKITASPRCHSRPARPHPLVVGLGVLVPIKAGNSSVNPMFFSGDENRQLSQACDKNQSAGSAFESDM